MKGVDFSVARQKNTQRRQRSSFPTGCEVSGTKRVTINVDKAQFEPLGHTKPTLMS